MCLGYHCLDLALCIGSNNIGLFAMSLRCFVLAVCLEFDDVLLAGLFVYGLTFSRLALESVQGRLLVVSHRFTCVERKIDQCLKVILVPNMFCVRVVLKKYNTPIMSLKLAYWFVVLIVIGEHGVTSISDVNWGTEDRYYFRSRWRGVYYLDTPPPLGATAIQGAPDLRSRRGIR